jgi:hypothetical protein
MATVKWNSLASAQKLIVAQVLPDDRGDSSSIASEGMSEGSQKGIDGGYDSPRGTGRASDF